MVEYNICYYYFSSAENVCAGQHGCQQVCYQADGQDKCSCHAGYELNQDGMTCSGIYLNKYFIQAADHLKHE